jgi:hypothetical protein
LFKGSNDLQGKLQLPNIKGGIKYQERVDLSILSHSFHLLAQGKTQGSTLIVHQQALTTGPFGNTCKADAVSPEVAIGGYRTKVSTTRENAMWIPNNT